MSRKIRWIVYSQIAGIAILLFGETQGLILISFKENNFIKFERICMQNNIPATTIGRVTGDGKFTFNNLINVQVKDLKNLMTIE